LLGCGFAGEFKQIVDHAVSAWSLALGRRFL
jgi:hypothetical protein